MKKFISVFLCAVVFTVNVIFTPYVTTVYASGIVIDIVKSISFDNVVKMVKSLYKVGYNVATTGSGDGAASSKALDSIWGEDSAVNKWLQTKLFPFMDSSRNIDLTKDNCPISYNNEKQLVEFNPTFTNELNQAVQDSVHALDGYYLIEPTMTKSVDAYVDFLKSNAGITVVTEDSRYYKDLKSSIDSSSFCFAYHKSGWVYEFCCSNKIDENEIFFFLSDGTFYIYRKSSNSFNSSYFDVYKSSYYNLRHEHVEFSDFKNRSFFMGGPIKLFYSKTDVENYLKQGRTYVPQLPSGGFKINIKYINNSVNYPDINVNLDSLVGKVETDVQADLDLTLKNYLDHLADITDGGVTTNPTPTPSGGGSGGDFGDGTTPTPKPDFSDGSLTDTNTLLQKILDKLTEFSTNHDKLAKTITDYIEKNDGKLEEILIAIQALSDGKTETEQNGCKYDFKALSKYLTDLWNNSDKKFDEMVKLLEENNKYQQKLVDSLNEIKALLIADTVMDFFKDRSQETAEKAKDKFPTSIPWDISLVLNSMSAEPKNPKFSLPIKIESFKINETIDIDLSTDEWEKLAKTCRYILSVTFILFLIHLSRKLFSNGGDD